MMNSCLCLLCAFFALSRTGNNGDSNVYQDSNVQTQTCRLKRADSNVQSQTCRLKRYPPMDITIKDKVYGSSWRTGGDTAKHTWGEIVMKSFEEVKRTGRHASACRFYDMYHPEIGALRKSKSYSALAPTNGMEYKDRKVEPDLRPFSPYKPKQSEWKTYAEKIHHITPLQRGKTMSAAALPPLPPTYRRQRPVPADLTRFENFAIYWNGRAKGLDYSQPFLFEPHRDNYDIMEDRRYHRIFWSPRFIPSQPTARHASQIMLTAY